MPYVEWSDEFSVGVEEIDSDHKKLILLLNDLYDAVEKSSGHAALGKILDGLILYVSYHFAHEEGLFLQAQYPDYEKHRQEHLKLTDQVKEVHQNFQSGGAETLPEEVLEFLKNWLYDHIMEADRAFGVYLNANPSVMQR